MGSSGKKRGVAARGAVQIARRTANAVTHPRIVNVLEDIVEPEDEVIAVAAAERRLDAEEDAIRAAETETEPVVGFEIAQVQILEARRHLAGVVEDRAIYRREDLPSVFGLQQERVRIAEAVAMKAAKIIRSTQRRQVVERHLASLVGSGRRYQRAQREDASVAEEREVLLHLCGSALKRIGVRLEIIETLVCEQIASAAARIATRLAEIDVNGSFIPHEVRLIGEPRC